MDNGQLTMDNGQGTMDNAWSVLAGYSSGLCLVLIKVETIASRNLPLTYCIHAVFRVIASALISLLRGTLPACSPMPCFAGHRTEIGASAITGACSGESHKLICEMMNFMPFR